MTWTSYAMFDSCIPLMGTLGSRSRISTAVAAFFCPTPGKASSLPKTSAALGVPAQMLPASPPYRSITMLAAATTQSGIFST